MLFPVACCARGVARRRCAAVASSSSLSPWLASSLASRVPCCPSSSAADASSARHLLVGIESSCDDSAVAVLCVRSGRLLAHVVSSSARLHAQYGGVMPALAARAHRDNLPLVMHAALRDARARMHAARSAAPAAAPAAGAASRLDVEPSALLRAGAAPAADADEVDRAMLGAGDDVFGVAVTTGPGLRMSLVEGVRYATRAAAHWQVPLFATHHLEAHCLAALLPHGGVGAIERFPFLTLLVSGGHCMLLLCRALGNYELLGQTLDDSVGEALDKTARLLGMRRGGAELETRAAAGDAERAGVALPLPLRRGAGARTPARPPFDFSFSGLKTACVRAVQRELDVDDEHYSKQRPIEVDSSALGDVRRNDIAAAFQRVCFAHLVVQTSRCMQYVADVAPDVRTLVVCGGVASNTLLRSELAHVCDRAGWQLEVPPLELCTDNGAMVAFAAYLRHVVRPGTPALPRPPPALCPPPPPPAHSDRALAVDVWPRWPLG